MPASSSSRWLRRATLVVVALLAVTLMPAAGAQDASPGGAALPRTALVEIDVPVEPRLPGPAPEVASTADQWLAASSDEDRLALLLDILAGIGIGVYTADGDPVLFGTETELSDPWLLDTEVALLSADPGSLLQRSVADLARSLEGLVETADGEPWSAEAIAGLVAAGMADAVADPTGPTAFPLLLARELVLRESAVDLADGVPTDLAMGSLAATLVAWDLLWPLMREGSPAFAMVSAERTRAGDDRTAPQTHGRRPAVTNRTAQACDRIASWATSQSPSIGRSGARAIADQMRMVGQSPPAQLLHFLLLAYALRVDSETSGPQDWHYNHPQQPGLAHSLAVQVRVVEDLPAMDRACAALLGIALPPRGPLAGVPVNWSTGILKDHGTIDCPASCVRTDADGRATLWFEPKTEPEPAGLGPERHDRTVVSAEVNYQLRVGNLAGLLTGTWRFSDVGISWHRRYRLELYVDSEIKGTALMRFEARATGTIDIGDPEASVSVGSLRTRTQPQAADPCRGESSAKGTGSVDLEVHSVMIFPDSRQVVLSIDSGPKEETPDIVTYKGCGPVDRFSKRMSVWELHFLMSHMDDMAPGVGLQLSDFRWIANDATWEQGGTIATLETKESCQGQCKGRTYVDLLARPDDDDEDGPTVPEIPPLPELPPLPEQP